MTPEDLAGQPKQAEQSLTSRAMWLIVGKSVAFGLGVALPLLLVRRLSQSDFGLYRQIFLFVSTAMIFLPVGFQMSAYYFFAREPAQRQAQIVFNILIFFILISGLAYLLINLQPQLLSRIFNNPEMVRYAPLIGLVVLTWVLSLFLDHIVLARQETRLATVLIVILQLSKTALLLAAVLVFDTIRALLIAAIVQGVVQIVVLLGYLRSRFENFWRSFGWSMMRRQLVYAAPLGVASILLQLQTTLDNYFVSNLYGADSYAIYAVGCFQLPLVIIITEAIGLTTLPRVTQLQAQGKTPEVLELFFNVVRKQSLIYLPLYLFLLLVGKNFIILLFTERYAASWPIFAVNLTLIPLAIVASATDPVMRAYSEHRYFLLRIRAVLVVILIAGLWFATRRFGLIGAISVMAAVNVMEAMLIAAKVGNILGMRTRDLSRLRDVGKIALAAAGTCCLTAIALLFVPKLPPFGALLFCGLLFLFIYPSLALILGVFTSEEWQSIRNMVRANPILSRLPSPPFDTRRF
ncbi:MAG TPA: oligosaccharide flippase family protein [Pyrinomonadaceae bacterium]|nr:oligosaccharide flippase family protein [Pyrinomonadaceae bacterium]